MIKFQKLFTVLFTFIFLTSYSQTNQKNEKEILALVLKTLQEKHVNPIKLDDNFSKKMFKSYIDSLDTFKMFFLQSDINEFKKYETQLDDQLKNNDLSFYDLTGKRYVQRMTEAKEIYTNLFKNKQDFTKNESLSLTDFKFCINQKELSDIWSKFIKNQILSRNKNKNNLEMSLEKFKSIIKDFEESRINNFFDKTSANVDNITKEFIFEKYLNAVVMQFDAHSKYYNPFNFEYYMSSIKGREISFGFTFTYKDNFIRFAKIIPGGPVWETNKISEDDAILKIGLENEAVINITGFSVNDIYKLLNNKRPSFLNFTLKKSDGSIKEVMVKRNTNFLKDSHIKSAITIKNKKKYAVISLPRFYNENNESELINSQDDFTEELKNLKSTNVDGLILDIRNNIGGSSESAISILSNFFDKKTKIAYTKSNENSAKAVETSNETKNWDKNVVLLVNSKTSSSAELMAKTFKEYNIGIVLGETTFGNGTIQQFLNLNTIKINKTENLDFGAICITTEKFYDAKGKTIQKLGVRPDVNFDSKNTIVSEIKLPTAFSPDLVKVDFTNKKNDINIFSKIVLQSNIRLNQNKIYKYIINNSFETDLENIRTLNIESFKKEMDALIVKEGESPLDSYKSNLSFLPTSNDEKTFKNREYLLQKRKQWYKSLSQDFMIEESINILEDMQTLK